jgi:hypothetical protein
VTKTCVPALRLSSAGNSALNKRRDGETLAVVEQKESFGKRHLFAFIVGGFAVLLVVIIGEEGRRV